MGPTIDDLTADPFPLSSLTSAEDEKDCLSFEPNAPLTLVIKGPIEATHVQV